METGDFIRLEGESSASLGIGKLQSYENEFVTVSFFDSPVSEPVHVQAPLHALRSASVPRQTRAYWFDDKQNAWRVGRVLSHYEEDQEIEVRFPNRTDEFLPVEDVFVRWDRPLEDPTGYLAQQINETPLFSDARNKYLKALMAQRRASMGMPALSSSIIDLEPHQIEVVRRVLQDPVQRYLLADEVGLGKTIEAGVLIRQYVLDDPTGHHVSVIVPPALVPQWRDELRRRFLLDVELDETVLVVPSDDPNAVRESLDGVGMVVVDEAHHIHQGHWLFDLLASEAVKLPRFLLLSATPVLGNETGFLEMLHLLDPLVFPLDTLDIFRRKIANRQTLAEAVAGLIPENLLQLDDYLDDLTELFPDDAELGRLAEALRTICDSFPEEFDPEFLDALSGLRSHVGETYRLDRRILRNRRKGVPGLTPDRSGVSFADFNPPSMTPAIEALEEWRIIVSRRLADKTDSEEAQTLAVWFFKLLEALSSRTLPETLVKSYVEPRLANSSGEEASALKNLLYRLELLGEEQESLQAVTKIIEASKPETKFIIFCSELGVAEKLQGDLTTALSIPVDRYQENLFQDYAESVFERFQNDPDHRVLVCDQRAEEGLNLQGGDKILIHFDLPYSPNRIEQRIGRVDRYGTGSSVQSITIRCTSNPFEMAWCSCLSAGLEIFNRSIASLQYLIDDEMRPFAQRVLFEGIEAIEDMQERLGGPDGMIARELRRIDDQDALDALIIPDEETYDDLFEEDDKWRDFQAAVDAWLINILNMRKKDGPDIGSLPPGDAISRYMLVRRGNETLIPLDRFLSSFITVLDGDAPGSSYQSPLSFPYTSRRQTSMLRKAREEKVRLLRYGDTFLKGLTELTTLDDRGRSIALWRQRKGYVCEGLADLYFRFDFLIETDTIETAQNYADATGGDEETAINALERRGDMAFPPTYRQIWLDSELEPVTDENLLGLLLDPYLKVPRDDGSRDLNLNWDRWAKLKEIDFPAINYWSDIVQQAREKAANVVGHDTDLEEKIARALKASKELDRARFAQLKTRIRHADRKEAEFEKRLLEIETKTAEDFYKAIEKPKITLDIIGAVFLSPHSLDYLAMRGGSPTQ